MSKPCYTREQILASNERLEVELLTATPARRMNIEKQIATNLRKMDTARRPEEQILLIAPAPREGKQKLSKESFLRNLWRTA